MRDMAVARITLRTRSPTCLGGGVFRGRLYSSLSYFPGTAIMGALVDALGKEALEFNVGPALPSGPDPRPVVPHPAPLLACKYARYDEEAQAWRCALSGEPCSRPLTLAWMKFSCPRGVRGATAERGRGYLDLSSLSPVPTPEMVSSFHVSLDPKTRTAAEGEGGGLLYAMEAIVPGALFRGVLSGPKERLDALQGDEITLWVGKGRSRGFGEVTMAVEEATPEDEYVARRAAELGSGDLLAISLGPVLGVEFGGGSLRTSASALLHLLEEKGFGVRKEMSLASHGPVTIWGWPPSRESWLSPDLKVGRPNLQALSPGTTIRISPGDRLDEAVRLMEVHGVPPFNAVGFNRFLLVSEEEIRSRIESLGGEESDRSVS